MALPDSLTVPGLKRRADLTLSTNDTLLSEFLEAALMQAQAPAPLGCGRLLVPDPAPQVGGEPPEDQSEPVTRTTVQRGRHVIVEDAREITKVEVDGVETTDYDEMRRDGLVVRLTLHEPHLDPSWGYGDYWGYGWGGWPRRRERKTIVVTGRFGFAAIPEDLAEGIYVLAARAWFEKQAQYADQVPVGEGAAVQTYFRQLPQRTKLAYATYTVPSGITGLM